MSRLFEFMDFRNRKLVRTVQIILGVFLIFLVVAGLLQLLPSPEYNEKAMAFLGALFATGYLVYLMDLVFVLSGLMFIFDKWSAFGAVLLAPITVNIFFFQFALYRNILNHEIIGNSLGCETLNFLGKSLNVLGFYRKPCSHRVASTVYQILA